MKEVFSFASETLLAEQEFIWHVLNKFEIILLEHDLFIVPEVLHN